MSGVSRTSTPCCSFASTAPSQKPVKTSSHDAPPLMRSAGVKMPFDVDGAVRRGFLGVRDDHLAEVDFGLDRVRGHHPELDEVVEVGELVQPRELVDVVDRKRDAVARRDLQQRAGRTAPSRCTCSSIFGERRRHGDKAAPGRVESG